MSVEAGNAAGLHVSQNAPAFPPSPLPAVQWVWADGTERLAQAVTAAQVGGLGYQTNLRILYRLVATTGGLGVGGAYWHFEGPLGGAPPRGWRGIWNTTSVSNNFGINMFLTGSMALLFAVAATPTYLRLPQSGVVTSAVAGTAVSLSTAGGSQPLFNGLLYRFIFIPRFLPASGKWFAGLSLPAPSGNFDFTTMVNCFGLVRPGAGANVQFIHNDGAGAPTFVDLGADFPAGPVNAAYELMIRVPNDNLAPVLQLENLALAQTISTQAPVAQLPSLATALHSSFYACNNADAAACGIGASSLDLWLDQAF